MRRQKNRERTIQTILEQARMIMRENGVAALSMHELARRMDMRAPSLYNYFSSLMEIYDSLFRMGFTLWIAHMNEAIKDAESWQEEIHMAMEAYMSFALKNPELYQLCFERPVPGFIPSEESLQISFGSLEEVYTRMENLKSNMQTDLLANQVADLIIAIIHGLTAMHMANQPELPLGQGRFGSLIPAAVDILDRAWAAPE